MILAIRVLQSDLVEIKFSLTSLMAHLQHFDQKWINCASNGANWVTDFGISFSAVNATLKMDFPLIFNPDHKNPQNHVF